MIARPRVLVDPVVVSMAVRYCLGRRSYAPGLVAEEVRAVLDQLGDQLGVIIRDIDEWLADDQRPESRYDPDREMWRCLLDDLKAQVRDDAER